MSKRWGMALMGLVIVGLAAAAGAASVPQQPKPAAKPSERVLQILGGLSERYGNVQTATGEFRQVKTSKVFNENLESTGEFWYAKPDRFRCEYKDKKGNDEMTNLIVNDILYVGLPRYKQLEIYPFGDPGSTKRHLDRILLGFGIATDQILENYDVTLLEESKDHVLMRFIPRFEDNFGLEAIILRLDQESMRPLSLEIHEGEDVTVLTLRDFKVNPKIDKDRFEPRFPKNWEKIDKMD